MLKPKVKARSKEAQQAIDAAKASSYKLTLPIEKVISHRFQALCKELDTDASKQLRMYIEQCVEKRQIVFKIK